MVNEEQEEEYEALEAIYPEIERFHPSEEANPDWPGQWDGRESTQVLNFVQLQGNKETSLGLALCRHII